MSEDNNSDDDPGFDTPTSFRFDLPSVSVNVPRVAMFRVRVVRFGGAYYLDVESCYFCVGLRGRRGHIYLDLESCHFCGGLRGDRARAEAARLLLQL